MPSFHPPAELLAEYASGALEESVSLVIATHLALCPECRAEVAAFEEIGAAAVSELDGLPLSEDSLDAVMAQLDDPVAVETPVPNVARSAPARTDETLIPQPLRGYLEAPLDELRWRNLPGVSEHPILSKKNGGSAKLMRIKPGVKIPTHRHEGREFTLVLSGGFSDSHGHYLRGDIAVADSSVQHQPHADAGEPCLCLAVTEAPVRLTGPLGFFLNPLLN